jgi:hypothetical protein
MLPILQGIRADPVGRPRGCDVIASSFGDVQVLQLRILLRGSVVHLRRWDWGSFASSVQRADLARERWIWRQSIQRSLCRWPRGRARGTQGFDTKTPARFDSVAHQFRIRVSYLLGGSLSGVRLGRWRGHVRWRGGSGPGCRG